MRKVFILSLFVLICLLCLAACNSDSPSDTVAEDIASEERVFSVGSKSFSTLAKAVEYLKPKTASSDYTIVMHKNAQGTGATISGIEHEIAIDFAGYRYTLAGNNAITVSGCTVEMKDMNMSSGRVVLENDATVSMTGTSEFSGSVSVTDSNLSINSSSGVSMALTVDNAVLEFESNVNLTELNAQENDGSIYDFSENAVVSFNNGNLRQILYSQDPLAKGERWHTDEMQSRVFHTGNTDYSYTFRAEFSFLTETTCRLTVEFLDNSEWKHFGTLEGTYQPEENVPASVRGRVTWEDNAPSYYFRVDYALVRGSEPGKYNLILEDPDGGTMTFSEVSHE